MIILASVAAVASVTVCARDPNPDTQLARIVAAPVPTATPKLIATPRPTPEPTPRSDDQPTPRRRPPTSAPVGRGPAGSPTAVILDVFGPTIGPAAIRVADCESGDHVNGAPYPINPRAKNGPHRGMFQINVGIHRARISRLGYTADDMYSAFPNAKVAKDLFDEQGWAPWTCGWAA